MRCYPPTYKPSLIFFLRCSLTPPSSTQEILTPPPGSPLSRNGSRTTISVSSTTLSSRPVDLTASISCYSKLVTISRKPYSDSLRDWTHPRIPFPHIRFPVNHPPSTRTSLLVQHLRLSPYLLTADSLTILHSFSLFLRGGSLPANDQVTSWGQSLRTPGKR